MDRGSSWQLAVVRWLRRAICSVIVAAFGGSACGEDVVPSDASPNAHENPLDSGFLATPSCTTCLEERCSLEVRACETMPACRALRDCRAGCTDAGCDLQCVSQAADAGGEPVFDAVAACAEQQCGLECAGEPATAELVAECRMLQDETGLEPEAACEEARECRCTQCARQMIACLGDDYCRTNLDCYLLYGCAECSRYPCVLAPIDPTLGGQDRLLYFEVLSCVDAHCERCAVAADGG